MAKISGIRRVFRLASGRATIADDVDAELAFHFEMAAAELEARGLSPAAARIEAERRFGDVAARRAELRRIDARQERRRLAGEWIQGLLQDLRVAVRTLRRAPGFASVVVLLLALGVGANVMMFGIVDRLLLRPPAFLHSATDTGRLFFRRVSHGETSEFDHVGYALLHDLQDGAGSVVDLVGVTSTEMVIGEGEAARLGRVGQASGNFWTLFDGAPALGRYFTPADDRLPAGAPVAVLGYETWQGRFGGARAVLGRRVRLGAGDYTVIGVAPKGFTGVDLRRVDAWVPLTAAAAIDIGPDFATRYTVTWFPVIARRHATASAATVNAMLTRAYVAHLRKRPHGAMFGGERPSAEVHSILQERGPHRSDGSRVVVWVLGVAAIVLLVACANVANLLLARGLQREREVAVRVALGVGRARLSRQLLAEVAVLAALGTVAGLVLARVGSAFVTRVLMPDIEWGDTTADPRRLSVAVAIAFAAGLLASAAPAVRALRADVVTRLRGDARAGGSRTGRLRGGLVLAQAALSALLLVGAGLFVRSLHNVRALDFGFDTDHVAFAMVDLRGQPLDSLSKLTMYRRLADRARGLPGVEALGTSLEVPYYQSYATDVRVPGRESATAGSDADGNVNGNVVSGDYFRAIGTRVLRGRVWDARDPTADREGVVISERLANIVWPNADAIGRCVIVEDAKDAPCRTVIGIVQDQRRDGPRAIGAAAFYVALRDVPNAIDVNALVIRTHGDAGAELLALHRALQPLAPGASYVTVRALADFVSPELRPWQLGATLFALFGALAFVVAVVGLYSALAYDVAQRRRDIGVRLALGARASDVVRLVVRRGVAIALGGVVLGLALALAAGRLVAGLLFEVSPRDPLTLGTVAVALLGAALAASLIPAWRAARVAPSGVLRAD